MVTSVAGLAGSGVGGVVAAPSQVPSVQQSASSTAFTPSAVSTPSSVAVVGAERVLSNPLARVIVTEYLDGSSNVVSQFPSSAVVAYLQNGLSADGTPKKSSIV